MESVDSLNFSVEPEFGSEEEELEIPEHSGWKVSYPPFFAQSGKSLEGFAKHIGLNVRPSYDVDNSHGCAAAVRHSLRNFQIRQIHMALTKAVEEWRKRASKSRSRFVFRVLVLDPKKDECDQWRRAFKFVQGAKHMEGLDADSLKFVPLRRETFGNDAARDRGVNYHAADQLLKDELKVDIVVANDCLYYHTPQSLFELIGPFINGKTLILANVKPIRMTHPGIYKETYRYSTKVVVEDVEVEEEVVLPGGIATTLSDGSVQYASGEKDEAVYTHPVPFWLYDYNLRHISDDYYWAIHPDRIMPFHTCYRVKLVRGDMEESAIIDARDFSGVVVSAGLHVASLPVSHMCAIKVNVENEESIQAYERAVSLEVIGNLKPILKVLPADTYKNMLPSIIKTTGESAYTMAHSSHFDLPLNRHVTMLARDNRSQALQDDGLPKMFADAAAVLSAPKQSKSAALVSVLKAVSIVSRGTVAAFKGVDFKPLNFVRNANKSFKRLIMTEVRVAQYVNRAFNVFGLQPAWVYSHKVLSLFRNDPLINHVQICVSAVCEGFLDGYAGSWEEILKHRLLAAAAIGGWPKLSAALLGIAFFGLADGALAAIGDGLEWQEVALSSVLYGAMHLGLSLLPLPYAIVIHMVWNVGLRLMSMSELDWVPKLVWWTEELQAAHVAGSRENLGTLKKTYAVDATGERNSNIELVTFEQEPSDDELTTIAISSNLDKSLLRPPRGAPGLIQVARKRMEVEDTEPIEGFYDQMPDRLQAWFRLNFEVMDPSAVVDYLLDRPWPNDWKRMRIQQYLDTLQGMHEIKRQIFVKVDERLPAKSIDEVKPRPIDPACQGVMEDFCWQPRLKEALSSPQRVEVNGLKGIVLCITKPCKPTLDMAAGYFDTEDFCLLFSGDDMLLTIAVEIRGERILRSVAVDLKSCDMSCGPQFQEAFVRSVIALSDSPSFLTDVMKAHEKYTNTAFSARAPDLDELGYKLKRKLRKQTNTGEPGTSIKAMFAWLFVSVRTFEKLASYATDVTTLLLSMPGILLDTCEEAGLIPEPETSKDPKQLGDISQFVTKVQPRHARGIMFLMELEATTFLAGTWILTDSHKRVWVPLKLVKALCCPTKLDKDEHMRVKKWFRILTHDVVSCLPVVHLFKAHTDVPESFIAIWKAELIRTKKYQEQDLLGPELDITWVEWERQVHTLLRKYGQEHLMSDFYQFKAEVETKSERWEFPFSFSSDLTFLHVIRFGELPVQEDVI